MILSIDTFSDILGISLIGDDKDVIFNLSYKRPKPFSESLIKIIDDNFKELNIQKSQLTSVCVNKGPGSYTGLRIGITTAKVLAYALNIKLYSYESLYAAAYKYRCFKGKILVAVYAGKGEAYVRMFDNRKLNLKPLTENLLIKKTQLEGFINDADLIIQKNLDIEDSIEIKTSLALDGALLALEKNSLEDPFPLEPIYLRAN